MTKANFGVVGMAVMGRNLALNIESRGYTVAIFNRSKEKTEDVIACHPDKNFVPSYDIESFVNSIEKPRRIMLMVQAGPGTDATIQALLPHLDKGDILIDGGNTFYKDTIRRNEELANSGINFIGTGVSGGEKGALEGPSIMPGGQKEAEARKAQAEAEKFAQLQEAEAIEAKGRAEAEAIRLKLEAEAKGLDQKAEAMKKMQEAAITEMVVDKLPEIARAVAEPLTKVDKITMYGEGNASKMVGDIMQSIDQVSQGAGFDIRQLLAGALGVNMTVNKLKEGEQPVIEAEELASKED